MTGADSAAPSEATAHGPVETVLRYLEVLFDPATAPADLEVLLHPDVEIVEHPNAVSPRGQRRSRDQALEGFRAGRDLLRAQTLDDVDVMSDGGTVVARAVWRGQLARAAGPLPAGTALRANLAMFFTVVDGRIRTQVNYDCYDPPSGR